jgi:hypothetical protein
VALIPVVGGLAIGGVLFVASRVNVPQVRLFDGLNNMQIGRQPLAPIPVPKGACSYLSPVHVRAVALDQQWFAALGGRDPWPKFKNELAAELPAFELDVARAEPHVPARIAGRFEGLIRNLRLGVVELPRAKSAADVLAPSGAGTSPLSDGIAALADASDFVGDACGYRLWP